jgi:NTP pyrophosphatase (non-canonical NTP hydrolase)
MEGAEMSDITLRQLQEEQRPWVQYNFPGRLPYYPLLGAMEELGELAHHHLKNEQGIRMNENHHEQKIDAVADVVIFLSDYCTANGICFQDALNKTWLSVKQRDWKINPETAHLEHP